LRPVTTFNIGAQHAASIQNVGGDLTVHELHAEARWSELRQELRRVEDEVGRLNVPPASRAGAARSVAAAAAELERPEPDRRAVATRLGRAAAILRDAGALSAAGTALVESLRRSAAVLGPAGKTLLALLPLA
jgi:hypothetical protein